MMRYKIFIVSVLGVSSLNVFSQSNTKDYKQSNGLIIEESVKATSVSRREFIDKQSNDATSGSDRSSAFGELKQALKKDPDNANLNYKLGLCYYFSYDQQLKALPYLTNALKNLTENYDFSNEKENKAPFSTYYFLADTYLEANQPDSALKYFSMYQDNFDGTPISTELGVFMSINAKEGVKNPRNVQIINFGNAVNSGYAETNPVMKLDNKLLFFSSRRPGANEKDTSRDILYDADIYFVSKNEAGSWSNAQPFPYNTESDEAPLYLNPNGDILYFRKTVKNNSDIYKTEFVNNAWTKPQAINEINTPFNETGVSLSADGKYLYFCSDQNKEAGKYDIFKCVKQANGRWGQLELLSATVNSPYNEVSPYISPDGRTLFYSTNGSSKKGMGSYDIYYTELKADNTWTKPSSMGYPINKTRADINYYVAGDDKRYYASLTENNSYDIFLVAGGGFDFESIAAGTDVITVTNEMGVTQVMETEKKVEKEVEVTQAVETIVEKEKEVEVIKTVEAEKEKEIPLASDSDIKTEPEKALEPELQKKEDLKKKEDEKKKETKEHLDVTAIHLDKLDDQSKAELIDKVKRYLTSELKENESVVYKIVYFDVNMENLKPVTKTELKLLANYLKENPRTRIELVGHTDNTGKWSGNNELSIKRAKSVYNYLIKKGIAEQRLHFYGKGSTTPFASNDTEEGKGKNRRVEIILIK